MNFSDTLKQKIDNKEKKKKILLMTHIVLGYPSFEVNRQVISQMAANGVDCIEMQIPFSEPMADGPVIARANQESLARGTRVTDCFSFAREMSEIFSGVHFIFMSYYNILFKMGEKRFLQKTADIGLRGTIVPDLPLEEGADYLQISRELGLAATGFFTPTSTKERMEKVAAHSEGFIYVVARRGVTGSKTNLDDELLAYLGRCRSLTSLPLAVGFGIGCRQDVAALEGVADMAVIGTKTIKLVDEQGPEAVGEFIASLRAD